MDLSHFADARERHEQTLRIFEATYGADHPDPDSARALGHR